MALNRRGKTSDAQKAKLYSIPKKKLSNKDVPLSGNVISTADDLYKVRAPGRSTLFKITVRDVTKALLEADGAIMRAAASLGVTYRAFSEFIRTHPSLEALVTDISEMNLDYAESKLRELIGKKNYQAIIAFLRAKGGHRGWRDDIPPPESKPIVFQYQEVGEEVNGQTRSGVSAEEAEAVPTEQLQFSAT